MAQSLLRTGAAVLLIAASMAIGGCRPSGTTNAQTAPPPTTGAAATAVEIQAPEAPRPRMMAPADLQAALATEDVVLINVCTSQNSGELPGTDMAIAYNKLEEAAGRLPADKSARIAIYCTGGGMSKTATDTLTAMGYADIIDLKGGTKAWRKAGLPIGDRTQ